jgi:hypothetical protein
MAGLTQTDERVHPVNTGGGIVVVFPSVGGGRIRPLKTSTGHGQAVRRWALTALP